MRDEGDKFLNFFRNFLTEEWISNQIKIMYSSKNQFKEIGATFNLLHPILNDYIDVWRQIRKAEALGEKEINLGIGAIKQQEIGRLLYKLNGLYNQDYLRSRLQSRDQFEDAIWELEVGLALKYTDFEVKFEEEKDHPVHDITATMDNENVAIECKNKHTNDEKHDVNSLFSYYLGSKIIDFLNRIDTDPFDIKVTIINKGSIDDVKMILQKLKVMFDNNENYHQIENKYIFEFTRDYTGRSVEFITWDKSIRSVVTGQLRSKREIAQLYKGTPSDGSNYKHRVIFRYTEPKDNLSLKGLISSANKQIGDKPGCVFIKIPKRDFQRSIQEVKTLLYRSYSNIHAVKVISLDLEYYEQVGVKVSREEHLVINERARNRIPDRLLDKLNKNMIFNKHKPDLESFHYNRG